MIVLLNLLSPRLHVIYEAAVKRARILPWLSPELVRIS